MNIYQKDNTLITAKEDVLPLLGLLPQMIVEGGDDIVSNLERNYQWFMGWTMPKTDTVDAKGIYRYLDDPPLTPLATYVNGSTVIYQYAYGMVAVVEDGVYTKWSRCD